MKTTAYPEIEQQLAELEQATADARKAMEELKRLLPLPPSE